MAIRVYFTIDRVRKDRQTDDRQTEVIINFQICWKVLKKGTKNKII